MANPVQLDNVSHKDLKILPNRGTAYGDALGYVPVVLRELRQLAPSLPLLLRKKSSGKAFELVALLGFSPYENVFADANQWRGDTMPLALERLPFMIGYANDPMGGEPQPVIHIDLDNPRVGTSDGLPVFLPQGGNSPYLEHINSLLAEIMQGLPHTNRFINLLVAEDLLEAVSIKIQNPDGSSDELKGFYTINEDVLRNLNAEQLMRLHSQNYLELIYMLIASLGNIAKMVRIRQSV